MKFIVPQNYNFKSKLLGFIDYSTALFNIIWFFIIFFILRFFDISLIYKVSLLIFFCFPLFLISLFGFENENIVALLFYILKFIKNRRIYFFNK